MARSRKRRELVRGEAENATISIVTAGQKLAGRYRLEREIARGAMGIVFEAYDEELNDRRVAVKVLPPEMATNKNAIKRFKGEAIAAIDLTHRNIVRLYSFDVDNEQAFLVMELLEGKSLEDRLVDEGPLALSEVCDIALQAAAGLDEAHSANVVHRDIKPANLLYKDEERTVLKVADFGIACNVRDTMTRLTGQDEGSSGTLLYIAPEQLKGKRPTPKADQYSLAATVYEALCGTPVFSGTGLSVQILQGEPEPIEDVPDEVNAVLARALAKEPEERFASCTEFAQALADGASGASEAEVAEKEVANVTESEEAKVEPEENDAEDNDSYDDEEGDEDDTSLTEEFEEVDDVEEDEVLDEAETPPDLAEEELSEPISLTKLLIFMVFVVSIGAYFLHPLYQAHENEVQCMYRLRQIGRALEMYQAKNQQRYPKDLQTLVVEGYLKGSEAIVCPESSDEYSYSPIPKKLELTSLISEWPLCQDRKPVHTDEMCVLFADYGVRLVTASEMKAYGDKLYELMNRDRK